MFKKKLPFLLTIELVILALALVVLFVIFPHPKSTKTPQSSILPVTSKSSSPSNKPQIQIPSQTGYEARIPILLYHYIGGNSNENDKARDALSITPDKFDEQMGYLSKAGYTPITLDTMMAGFYGHIQLPAKPVVITFDDGYIDLYHNAFKLLKKYNFHAVAFIPTGLVGTKYYASWDMLSEMQASGLLSFESHSVLHSNLTSLSSEQLTKELSESKKTLEAKFGIPVNFIAYPYGTSNPSIWEATKRAGYVGGLGTWYSNIQSEGTLYNMPRIKISGSWDLTTFASKL